MKILGSIFLLVVGFFAFLFSPPAVSKQRSVNAATVWFENQWYTWRVAFVRAVLRISRMADSAFGARTPFAMCVVDGGKTIDDQLLGALGGINERLKKLDEIEKAVGKNAADYELVTKVTGEIKAELDSFRRMQIALKAERLSAPFDINRQNLVSDECARHLGLIALGVALKSPSLTLTQATKDMCEGMIKNHLGVQAKAALTASDIPLPTQYAGEVVELVYQFGQARRYGTVYPLGAGVVKLPKLTTDTAFGLIASSGTVTEVSPAVGFVTFTAEKFGGLIRLPSEIDEDSIVAMGQFIARYAARNIAKCEDYQFFMSTGAGTTVNGTGKGLVKAAVDDSCLWNQSGSSSGGKTKQSEMTLADLRNLRSTSTLSGAALMNSAYYMHPTYEAALVAFNTSATVTPYLRGNGPRGEGATLDGWPIRWINVMTPFSATASVSLAHVLFGDATFQYLGLRNGIRFDTSREAAFATDEILVRALERMTVALMASKAVAALVTDAS